MGLFMALVTAVALCRAAPARALSAAAARENADLDQTITLMRAAMDIAERTCLSNTSSTEVAALKVNFQGISSAFSSAATVEKKMQVVRGAAQSLPAAVQVIENDNIRTCLNAKLPLVFGLINRDYLAPDPATQMPDPIDFRFNFARGPSNDRKSYTPFLRSDLRVRGRPVTRRLVVQDPQGEAYFQQDIPYPGPGERIEGAVVAERNPDAYLTSVPPTITDVCIQRPGQLPAANTVDYDVFDCAEGKSCQPSKRATGWLSNCPPPSAAPQRSSRLHWFPEAAAAETPLAATTATVAPEASSTYWSVPSLSALTQRKSEGVGYTVFSLKTSAFEHREVSAVEVDVRVNGIPVLEDGLPARLRPVPNDSNEPFIDNFALQTLDFEGAAAGCDGIDIELRAARADGRHLEKDAYKTTLTYVALRDVAPRTQPLGDATLTWSAAYITPAREWRNIAELASYIYSMRDPQSRVRAIAKAESDKRWLDRQDLRYQGQRVVGVIRPARTVQPDGTAAYGLGAGLVLASGQVRFTFSDADARAFDAFLIGLRAHNAEAARIISPAPYIFQAVGGSHTAPGLCE